MRDVLTLRRCSLRGSPARVRRPASVALSAATVAIVPSAPFVRGDRRGACGVTAQADVSIDDALATRFDDAGSAGRDPADGMTPRRPDLGRDA